MLLAALFMAAASVHAGELTGDKTEETAANIRIEEPAANESSARDQFFTLALGAFSPESAQVSNGAYRFDYGSGPTSYQVQASWAARLVQAAGGFYFEGTVAFSSFSGSAVPDSSSGVVGGLTASSYSLGLLGLDARLMYSLDALPVRWLAPFVDAGYRCSVYYQPGSSGLESAEGTVGNPVAAAGLRFWLNRRASLAGAAPWFVMAKVERVLPQGSGAHLLNLASTSIYGGLSLGL